MAPGAPSPLQLPEEGPRTPLHPVGEAGVGNRGTKNLAPRPVLAKASLHQFEPPNLAASRGGSSRVPTSYQRHDARAPEEGPCSSKIWRKIKYPHGPRTAADIGAVGKGVRMDGELTVHECTSGWIVGGQGL